jgi:Na+/proline symporter
MIVFTFYGGMEAVVWIEVAQLGIYIAGALGAAIVLARGIPGGLSAAIAVGGAFNKFQVLDFTLDFTRSYVFWSGVIGGCFLTMSTHGTDQYLVQRYLCTNSARQASKALLVSGAVVLAQFIGFLFIGVLLFAFYRPDRVGYMPSDQVFPDFITRHLPSGLAGLVVAAIFAAAMSSSLNSIAATFVADLYAPVVRGRDDRHYLKVSHVVTIVAGLAQIGVGLAMHSQKRSALDAALSVASLINGPILGVFMLGALKRGGPASALAAMIAGIAVVMTVWLTTPIAWPWFTVIGSLTTVLVGSAGAWLEVRRAE